MFFFSPNIFSNPNFYSHGAYTFVLVGMCAPHLVVFMVQNHWAKFGLPNNPC
jgi:hypothetical protein